MQILKNLKSSLAGEMERWWESMLILCKVTQRTLFCDLFYIIIVEVINDEAYVVEYRKLTKNLTTLTNNFFCLSSDFL
jgi:hypothetical protein